MMQNKIRHHYVPVGLSKNFCSDGKRLYLYDLEREVIMPSSPKDVFLGKKLHSLVTDDGSIDHNVVEDEFMHIEGFGIEAIKEFILGADFSFERRDAAAAFLALQQLRTPVYRKGMEEIIKGQLNATAKVLDAQGAFGELPDALKPYGSSLSELLDNGTVAHNITLPQVTMQGLVALPELHNILIRMNWCLLESEGDDFFILSDHPCAVLDPDLSEHGMGIGFVSPRMEFTMPIGKNHCLMLTWKDVPAARKITQQQVVNINKRSAVFGERLFVYPTETKKVLRLLMPYKQCNFESQLITVPCDDVGQMVIAQNTVTDKSGAKLYRAIKPLF